MTGRPPRTPLSAPPASAIVVGGGIGGSAIALLLARAGTKVTLLERSEDPVALGAGILLQANGLAVLYGLGLRAGLRLAASELDAVRLYRADGAAPGGPPGPRPRWWARSPARAASFDPGPSARGGDLGRTQHRRAPRISGDRR